MLFFRFDAKARTVVIGLEPRPAEPIFPKKAVRQSSTDFESSLCLSNREAKNRDRALKRFAFNRVFCHRTRCAASIRHTKTGVSTKPAWWVADEEGRFLLRRLQTNGSEEHFRWFKTA